MKRSSLIAGTALVAVALSSVAVLAHDRGDRQGRGEGRIETMLERFDTNGDGAITMAEIEAAGVERFNTADTNGDGQLRRHATISESQTFAAATV